MAKKMDNATYDQYVRMGKELVNSITCHQAQIAYYATKVCEIKHGGRTRSSTYTLTKYAADIGVHHKTLMEWVSTYRNVIAKVDLDPEKVTKKDWTVATRVQKLFHDEKRTVQKIMGISGKKQAGMRQDVSAERVKDLFKQNYDGPSFQNEMYTWNNQVLFIKNKLAGRDLSLVSLSSLVALKENLDAASDHILRAITKAQPEKKKVIKRTKTATTATA